MRLKIVPHRRRREGKTNYRKRLDLLKSRKVRFVVRKSSKNIYCQLVEYQKAGDKTLLSSNSQELRKFGWNAECGNLPAAYLTGLLCGLKAKEKKISDVVLDTGLYRSVNGSRIYAALKGALDSGLDVKHSEEVFPSQERISGKHIAEYAAKIKKEKPTQYKKQFSGYLEQKVNPEELTKLFESTKAKILSEGK